MSNVNYRKIIYIYELDAFICMMYAEGGVGDKHLAVIPLSVAGAVGFGDEAVRYPQSGAPQW